MAEDATLRDTVVEETTVSTEPKETTSETTTIKVADTEAADIGKALLEAGFTKEQVPDLLQAPGALNALRHLVQNNPQEFITQLEKTDPQTGEKFLEAMSDIYLKRKEHLIPKDDKGKKDANSELMQKVQALEEKANRLESEQAQRNLAAARAALESRYNSRVDDILSQKEIKDLGLTKSDIKGMRARLSTELAQDQAAVKRVSNGNFVDIPKVFQTILDEHVADRKALADAEKGARERTKNNSFAEFMPGADIQIDDKAFDSWDATEEAFGAALTRAR